MGLKNKIENWVINQEKKMKTFAVISGIALATSMGFFGGIYYSKMNEQTSDNKSYEKIAEELGEWTNAFRNYYRDKNQ